MSPIPPRPSVPVPYAAGTIVVPAGKPVGILDLIHEQLSPDAPGTSVEFRMEADPSNLTPVFVGQASSQAGPVSCSNYGYSLSPMGPARKYRASYPGTGTPQGVIQVFSETETRIHVEINE